MFPSMSLGMMLKIGAVIGVIVAGAAFYFHYTSLVSERDLLAQNNVILQQAFETEQIATNKLRDQLDEAHEQFYVVQESIQEMAENQANARNELEELNGKFRKHDLEELAKKKPGLIERRLNDGTDNINRMLEESTRLKTE